jgi:hypothetical protein
VTPEEHYAHGLELLDLAERSIEIYQIQANSVLAQGHFSAAVAGTALSYIHAVSAEPEPAADHHASLAAGTEEG